VKSRRRRFSLVLDHIERHVPRKRLAGEKPFADEARFLRSWLERPLVTGALTPSGKMLARMMASYVDPRLPGHVIELGPGTGPVTEALIRRGIAQERLILVEFNPDFCRMLKRRFPKATIIEGDAYNIRDTLKDLLTEPACATLSSLPLFTKPVDMRVSLMQEAQSLMHDQAPFIQFTYAVVPPIPKNPELYSADRSNKVWLNLPPARVWVYRAS
jgi:phosphatidylethanolamine/phosphatidyl-N-methylethanolamine N-methyltransferase